MTVNIQKAGVDLATLLAPLGSGWPTATATNVKSGNADLNSLFAEAASGSAAASVGILAAGVDVGPRFASIGTTSITASNSGNISGSTAAGSGGGTVTSSSSTASGQKGKLSYTFAWTVLSVSVGSTPTITSPSSASTTVSGTIPASTTWSGTIRCTVSDGTTTATTDVTYSLQNTSVVFTPVTHVKTAAGSFTETAPVGASFVVVEVWGSGGGGGAQDNTPPTGRFAGGGAASGDYNTLSFSVTSGGTISFTVAVGGAKAVSVNSNGSPGNISSISSGSIVVPGGTFSAHGGGGGGGAGINGPSGIAGAPFSNGNAGSAGGTTVGGAGGVGKPSTTGHGTAAAGAGGHGAGSSGALLANGADGQIAFNYT